MDNLKKKIYQNLLMVAGTGRNSGKTSFICKICEEWNLSSPLVCIKISNHIHIGDGVVPVYACSRFSIYEEANAASEKDTSRMLRAGADKVLFIEADREFVYKAFIKALNLIPDNAAVICESGTLRRFAQPSLFIMLYTRQLEPKESSKDLLEIADFIFYSDNGNLQIPQNPVIFKNNQWKLNHA